MKSAMFLREERMEWNGKLVFLRSTEERGGEGSGGKKKNEYDVFVWHQLIPLKEGGSTYLSKSSL